MRTRPPTGAANWPMLLVEGREGARKTSEALRLSADPRIGASYVIEVGERRVDEYASLGNFMVVEHDGTLRQIVQSIYDVMLQPPLEGRPTLLIIDSGTALWDLVKRQAEFYARSSKRAREILANDEHAEIEVGHQAWNRAKDPWWWAWMNELRAWPGVLIVTARSDEVSKFVDGKPVANQTDYRVDIERGTPFIFDATVRMRAAKHALVTSAKSLNFSVPDAGVELPLELPLAHVVFELFKAGGDVVLTIQQAKASLMSVARSLQSSTLDVEQREVAAKAACSTAWEQCRASLLSEFDHVAMSMLVDALPVPGGAQDEFEVGDADKPIDGPPDDAGSSSEAATSPPAASDAPASSDQAAEPHGDAEALTEQADHEAFGTAPQEVLDSVIDRVRRMATVDVDTLLKGQALPLTGNVQTRRARLAARLVHVAMLEAAAS